MYLLAERERERERERKGEGRMEREREREVRHIHWAKAQLVNKAQLMIFMGQKLRHKKVLFLLCSTECSIVYS